MFHSVRSGDWGQLNLPNPTAATGRQQGASHLSKNSSPTWAHRAWAGPAVRAAARARARRPESWTAAPVMKTPRQRDEERRQEKLALMQEQIDAGTLTVRRMTAEERAATNPPRPRPERGRGRRSRG
jgi:hypothetical protein